MAPRGKPPTSPTTPERVVDVDVAEEMQGSFLEYAYSVIYSRALPDARDGMKPVQRRILYTMAEMGLRPDKGHVKSARVVGEVMGRLHPHGDGAIYDAMVRMAQPFTFRLPLVDGHGNFGSLDDGPAAYRYTEARLAPAALAMTESIDEEVVDWAPNYDGREREPVVLPAAIPALLVNGASGIAVGMATNLPPHNLTEVIAAARHLLEHPKAGVEELMTFVPGPDLPTGGRIIGLSGIRDAYREGRGSFRMRATVSIEQVSPRRTGLIFTELPYNVGPEKVIERIKDAVTSKKLQGIADVTDLSDGFQGTRLVVELKSGFNPQAVLAALYKVTPLEEQFSVNAVALVEGAPKTLGLVELLQVFLDHRLEVVRRRSEYRKARAEERLHLVSGLLVAILDIDEVIAVIRSSDDTAAARERLQSVFDLSEVQANHILEMPLRRLTKFSKLELEREAAELREQIAGLESLLTNPKALRKQVSAELAEVAAKHGNARRTVLQEDDGTLASATTLEIADDPVTVMLSSTGLLARLARDVVENAGNRGKHDLAASAVETTARGEVGLLTSLGRVHRVNVVDLPALSPSSTAFSLKGGGAIKDFVALERNERPITLVPLDEQSILAIGTASGVVKRVAPELPKSATWEVIRLEAGDEVVGGGVTRTESDQLVFITDDAQLLRFSASNVRPQGRGAAGMAGINLAKEAAAIGFFVAAEDATVLTQAVGDSALPGTDAGSAKVTALAEFPAKGRATGGVRCQTFRKGEERLAFAAVASGELRAATANGSPVDLPPLAKRDGTGTPQTSVIAAAGGTIRR